MRSVSASRLDSETRAVSPLTDADAEKWLEGNRRDEGGRRDQRQLGRVDGAGLDVAQVHREGGGVVVVGVHSEDVVRRGEHERPGVGVGEDHGLQHVDGLGDVRHDHALGVTVERVEGRLHLAHP